MGRTKDLLEKLHYDNLNEMHFMEQERPYLSHFKEKQVLDTKEEQNNVKSD